MMFEVKMTGRAYKQLKAISKETGKKPHVILDELLCGAPEQGIDEFNEQPIDEAPVELIESTDDGLKEDLKEQKKQRSGK